MTNYSENIFDALSEKMRATPQSAEWHGEGDVLTHTKMVCEALCSLPEYGQLSDYVKTMLLSAAQLHDIGKIRTTKEIFGNIETPHHAPAGSRMAREQLWLSGMCGTKDSITLRESICQLINYHSFPPHAIDTEDAILRLHRIAANGFLLPQFTVRMLCMLSKADMLGRICKDQGQMLEQIAFCEELAKGEECFDSGFSFPSDFTMHSYLKGRDIWKDQMLYDDTWGTVYMMSGLPGTGKDTWIHENLSGIPMISLDEIRRSLKISPAKNQGIVANLAKEKAKEYLRQHQSFVWNATNITQTMRRQLVSLFESYKARVHIIYLETDWQTLLMRNRSREAVVPQPAIESMLGKLELPEIYEASLVKWIPV